MKKYLLIGLFFLNTIISCTSRKDVNSRDYAIITPVKEVSEFYEIPLDTSGTKEKTEVVKYIDGSAELSYTYDFIETEEFVPLFYTIKVEKERSVKDAMEVFLLTKTTFKATNAAVGLTLNEVDEIALPGEQTYYAIRLKNNEPNGIILIIRKNSTVYSLITSGLYSSDHSLVTDLVLPKLDNLESIVIR